MIMIMITNDDNYDNIHENDDSNNNNDKKKRKNM